MKIKWILYIVAFGLLSACSKEEIDTTNPLMDAQTMVHFLYDLHLYESIINERYASLNESPKIFGQLFDKYQVTAQQFDSAVVWYKFHHEKYMAVYDQVRSMYQQEEAKIKSGIYNYYLPPLPSIWKYYGAFPTNDSTLIRFADFAHYLELPAAEFTTHNRCRYPYVQRLGRKTPYWKIGD